MTLVRLLLLAGTALALGPLLARAAEPTRGFLDRVHKDPGGKEAKYVLFVPHDYKPGTSYPLILFLHGIGESGTDGRRQAEVGLGPAVRKRAKSFPAFVLF